MQSHSEVLGISTSPWECVWEGGNNSAPNPDNVVFFGSWPFRMPHLNSGFPDTSESTCTSSGEGIGYPLQYSGLENSMDCIVHGVANSRLSLASKLIIAHTNWDWDKMSDFPWMKQNYKGEITVCFRHWEFKDPSLLPTGMDHLSGTTGRVRSLLLTLAAYWGHLECLRIDVNVQAPPQINSITISGDKA